MQDTVLQPIVQTPTRTKAAIWTLSAMVIGLLAFNVATLTNDQIHSTRYSWPERTMGITQINLL